MQKFCTFVALTFLFAVMAMAQVPGGSQLRGMAEMKNGEKLEGWVRFERETMILTEIDGNAQHQFTAEQLKEVRIQMEGYPQVSKRVPGLRGYYYSTPELSGKMIERVDAQINFRWGTAAPMSGIPADRFSVRWEGEIETLNEGNYTFHLRSDDGARLFVDGSSVIDRWRPQAESEHSGTIDLEARRRYPIRLDYFDGQVLAVVALSWTPPGGTKQLIGGDRFYQGFGREGQINASGTGLFLKGGSFLSGAISEVDDKVAKITYIDGKELKIPRKNIGGLQLSLISSSQFRELSKWDPGCMLRGGDYFESTFVSFDQDALRMRSPLLGKKDFRSGQVKFIKLRGFNKNKANFELHTKSGSRLRADWLMLDSKRALVKDNSFCWINLDPLDVVSVYGIPEDDGTQRD
jgi:hypothetical protein